MAVSEINKEGNSLVSMIAASKSPPPRQDRFSEMKRYLETKHAKANPYLSPVSLGRLQQLQIGKRFLKEVKSGAPSSLLSSGLVSPHSKAGDVPHIPIPKRSQPRHDPHEHYPERGSSGRTLPRKAPLQQDFYGGQEPLANGLANSPLSPELTSETRLDPSGCKFRLHLQPWSIEFIPGKDPNTFPIPPARKIAPNEKIERELKDFKREIDEKFAKTHMKHFVFPRTVPADDDSSFVEFGDDLAYASDTEQESEPDSRMLSSPPHPGAISPQPQPPRPHYASASRAPKPSPLRQMDFLDQRKVQRSSSRDIQQPQMAHGKHHQQVKRGGAGVQSNLKLYKPKVVPYGYAPHSQAVAALVSPTTRAYEKKAAMMREAMKMSAKRNKKQQGGGGKPSGLQSIDDYERHNFTTFTSSYPATSIPSTRAWEDVSALVSPKSVAAAASHHGGGGTGSALTPPPANLSESTYEAGTHQASPRNMTHRSFILPGERQDRKHHPHAHPHHPHQPYLHKSGTHSKSQSYKQKLIPNSTVFTPSSTGRVMKKSRTPRQLLSKEHIQPPQSVPLTSSPTNSAKPPSGGTGSITYHQETTTANTSSYRSLRQGNSSSRKPQPLLDMSSPPTPGKGGGGQSAKSYAASSAHHRVLPPELIASYLKTGQRAATTTNRGATAGAQKQYLTGYAPQYHGNWSILGGGSAAAHSGKSPADSLYMSHESVKSANPKTTSGGTRRSVHQRSKTSHVESSQSQLGVSSETESTKPKTSGRKHQSQFSAGRKKKPSVKGGTTTSFPMQQTFDVNTSYDKGLTGPRALHSSTLSRELNMINQELQNADKTMKLLVDAEDLKLGYLKHPGQKGGGAGGQPKQARVKDNRSALRNLGLSSPTHMPISNKIYMTSPLAQTYGAVPTSGGGGGGGMPISPSSGGRPTNSYMQEQYKKRFKNQLLQGSPDLLLGAGGASEVEPPVRGPLPSAENYSRSSQRKD